MVSSVEAERRAASNKILLERVEKVPADAMKKFTEALTGLKSCDVERGTELYWLNEGRAKLDTMQELHNLIMDLSVLAGSVDQAIGAFRLRQRSVCGKPNLSIGRFKDVDRLIRMVEQYISK